MKGCAAHVPSYHNPTYLPTSQYDDDDDEVVPFKFFGSIWNVIHSFFLSSFNEQL